MQPLSTAELEPENIVALAGILGGILVMLSALGVGVISVVTSARRRAADTREREQTKRELAAYVAEGSMTADEAYRILNGDGKKRRSPFSCGANA